jgi:hypothetical protein
MRIERISSRDMVRLLASLALPSVGSIEESRDTERSASLWKDSTEVMLGLCERGGRMVGRAEGERETGETVDTGALNDPPKYIILSACELF